MAAFLRALVCAVLMFLIIEVAGVRAGTRRRQRSGQLSTDTLSYNPNFLLRGEKQPLKYREGVEQANAAIMLSTSSGSADEGEDSYELSSGPDPAAYSSSTNLTEKIEHIIRGPNPPMAPTPPKKKGLGNSKFILFAGLAVLAVVVIVAGFVGYNKKKKARKAAEAAAVDTPPREPVPMPPTPAMSVAPKMRRKNSSSNALTLAGTLLVDGPTTVNGLPTPTTQLAVPPSTPCTAVLNGAPSDLAAADPDIESDGATTEFSELTEAPLVGAKHDGSSRSSSQDSEAAAEGHSRHSQYLSDQSAR